jgi:hypothetical protein
MKKEFNRKNRPDFSEYLSHFTKDGEFCHTEQADDMDAFRGMNAFERLCSILKMKEIKTSIMPWTNTLGVCFTECPWSSLLIHTQQYSSYGIGFTKAFIYRNNGAPVFYMRKKFMNTLERTIKDEKILQEILAMATPYSPSFETKSMRNQIRLVDYTHEREWRLPSALKFDYTDVSFVIIKNHKDYDSLPDEFKAAFDRNKIIVMDNYKLIEELWPVHIK